MYIPTMILQYNYKYSIYMYKWLYHHYWWYHPNRRDWHCLWNNRKRLKTLLGWS